MSNPKYNWIKQTRKMNTAIILAAGKGTRMKTDMPKCAFPLLKKPMIEYIIESLEKIKIDRIICVVGHKKEILMDILKDRVEYAYQEEQLGTGHAVMCASDYVLGSGYTIILPGDTPLIDEDILNQLINTHLDNKNDFTIGTITLDNPFGFGRIIRNNNGNICKIIEEKDANQEEKLVKEINTGLFCIDNSLLKEALPQITNNNAKGEYYLTDIVEILSNKAKIGSFSIKDTYKLNGINDLYTLSCVERDFKNAILKKHMLNGVNIINPDTVTIGSDVTIEEGTTIYPGTIIMGKTHIGKNCVVGPNSDLFNATLKDGAKLIHSLCYDSTLNENSSVGPFSHLRMNTIVGIDDRIGNFVEIKNSTLGPKTNVAHLTYIGDTDCGGGVNFGCGTVTVNYDGKNKFRTLIGDNVFIGCNTNLIAPVSVGSNSLIAAGSTITESIDENDFAIARSRQITKKGYAKNFDFKKKYQPERK